VAVQFPTSHHEVALEAVLAAHRADASVLGVLLCGSLARGTARQDSDIDQLIVLADDEARRSDRTHTGPVVVEQGGRTEAGWREQFAPVPADQARAVRTALEDAGAVYDIIPVWREV